MESRSRGVRAGGHVILIVRANRPLGQHFFYVDDRLFVSALQAAERRYVVETVWAKLVGMPVLRVAPSRDDIQYLEVAHRTPMAKGLEVAPGWQRVAFFTLRTEQILQGRDILSSTPTMGLPLPMLAEMHVLATLSTGAEALCDDPEVVSTLPLALRADASPATAPATASRSMAKIGTAVVVRVGPVVISVTLGLHTERGQSARDNLHEEGYFLRHDLKDPLHFRRTPVDHLIFCEPSRRHFIAVPFHGRSKIRHADTRDAQDLVCFQQGDPQRPRQESPFVVLEDVVTLLDLLDVLRHRCIRPDAVPLHQSKELLLVQRQRWRRSSFRDGKLRGRESLSRSHLRQDLARPVFVSIHIQPVPLQHLKATSFKLLANDPLKTETPREVRSR
mmetsp:Transcript_8527/g.32093  ORF Transcript_8527/g.32093 Transcript_8527/m.32093 type:complete len:390 (-) Transcript_8527:988-2157(-)